MCFDVLGCSWITWFRCGVRAVPLVLAPAAVVGPVTEPRLADGGPVLTLRYLIRATWGYTQILTSESLLAFTLCFLHVYI